MASQPSSSAKTKPLIDLDDKSTTTLSLTPSSFNYAPMVLKNDARRIVPFKVIICGLMRTGTSSECLHPCPPFFSPSRD